jgi:hypothetical protein
MIELPYDISRASREVQSHYVKMVSAGESVRFAEMCALSSPPCVHGTDTSIMRGRQDGNWMDALPQKQAEWMLKEAKAAGINTTGKYYMSGIADSRAHCDGEAWISGKDDLLRVAKQRKLHVQGQVNYDPPEPSEPPKRTNSMNPKLVRSLAKKEMRAEPGLTLAAASKRVREKHSLSGWNKG